jgi:hypothetical protein
LSIELFELAADALGELLDQVVFVGARPSRWDHGPGGAGAEADQGRRHETSR